MPGDYGNGMLFTVIPCVDSVQMEDYKKQILEASAPPPPP